MAHKFRMGITENFDVEFPQYIPDQNAEYPGLAVRVAAVSAIGSDRVNVNIGGVGASTNVTFYQGQFIQFSGDKKVYMITEGITFNEMQTGYFRIFPRLYKPVALQQLISLAPMMNCRYSGDGSNTVRVTIDGVIAETIDVVEV